MGKSLIQPPIKINFHYGTCLSSGCLMDGAASRPWQAPGAGAPHTRAGPRAGQTPSLSVDARLPSLNFHFLLHFVSDTTLVSETEELALLFTLCFSELSCVGGFVLNMPIEPGPAPHRAAVFALMGNFRFFFSLREIYF